MLEIPSDQLGCKDHLYCFFPATYTVFKACLPAMSAPTSFGLQASSPFGSPFFIVPVMSQSCTHAQAQIQFSCIACSPKEFLCLVLTLRYQDQILLNHVACQICLPLPGFWFSTHKCGASSSPRPTTWIYHWFLAFVPCAMDAMDGDGGGRISAPGRKKRQMHCPWRASFCQPAWELLGV